MRCANCVAKTIVSELDVLFSKFGIVVYADMVTRNIHELSLTKLKVELYFFIKTFTPNRDKRFDAYFSFTLGQFLTQSLPLLMRCFYLFIIKYCHRPPETILTREALKLVANKFS